MKYNLLSTIDGKGSGIYPIYVMTDIKTHEEVIVKVRYNEIEVIALNMLKELSFIPHFARIEPAVNISKDLYCQIQTILVMEYIPGDNLEEIIEDITDDDYDNIMNCFIQLPMVFKQIYDKGIIHGDINWNQRFRFGCS